MTKSLLKIIVLFLALTAILSLAGCGGQPTDSWPGLGTDGDVLFVSAGPKVYALGKETGAQSWVFPSEEAAKGEQFFAPAVQDPEGQVYVGTSSDKLHAFTEPGKESWVFATTGAIVGSATVVDGTVYVGSNDRKVYALSAADGSQEWAFDTNNWNWAAPVYEDGSLYVGSMDHHVYCLDAETGTERWTYEAGGAVASSPRLAVGKVFFGDFNRRVHALDASDGSEVWNFSTDHWVWGTPAYADETLFVGDLSGKVYALAASTGDKLWEFKAGSPVRASLVAHGDLVYALAQDGVGYVLDAKTGTEVRRLLPDDVQTAGGFLSDPVLSGDVLYVVSERGFVYAFLTTDGTKKWVFSPITSD